MLSITIPLLYSIIFHCVLVGLSFLFIEMKELCEARAKLETSSNFQIYTGKTDDEPPI